MLRYLDVYGLRLTLDGRRKRGALIYPFYIAWRVSFEFSSFPIVGACTKFEYVDLSVSGTVHMFPLVK